jgi:fructose-1,6-bisphosphatase/inositol monophosphatase family enzyme
VGFAAGELIAREAGALVCDFTGGHNYMPPATSLQVTHALLKPCWQICVMN